MRKRYPQATMHRFIQSFRYAIKGLHYIFREEANFYIQSFFAASAVAAGWILGIDRTDWLFVTVAITLVLGAEILNTILEDICNEIQPEHHTVVGKAKDMMAAFVLITSVAALIIGGFVFIPFFF